MITNPILRGFNPDPSIVRVGDDYFIATSTFEWFPGVQIHHSRDLIHWKLITHPLSRTSQLDMLGNADSGGIWAPCLSWHDGLFYLIYTDVKNWRDNYKESHNYLVTAPDIMGPWSEPAYLNSSGFDPSLFHDADGHKWYLNMIWDFRAGGAPGYFAGILLQEFDANTQQLTGPIQNIFKGSPIGWVEGPHLYKHNDYYYLLTAEGGTGWNHAATMARSKSIDGPYEIDPQNPLITSHGKPELELQKAGHASIVETQNGEWYLVHLCSRPVVSGSDRRCILGRETAIQKCVWTDDGWLRLEGGNNPRVSVPAPDLPAHPFDPEPARDDFDAESLNVNYQSLRVPADETWCSLSERPGWLRLYGRESLGSRHRQSLIARRVQAFRCEASTCLEFGPETFQQMAGLTAFYDVTTHYYLYVTSDEGKGTHLNMLAQDLNSMSFPLDHEVNIDGWERVYLKVTFDYATLQFAYSQDGENWKKIGPVCDATKLSDDYGPESFTGAFVGLCAQDLSGRRKHADFDWFEYRELM